MKVIDLLNKIANGEEVPKKIKYDDFIFYWNISKSAYYEIENHCIFSDNIILDLSLNDEVEIIEEDKKIEKLKSPFSTFDIVDKINEIRDVINEIMEKLNEVE